jgi:pimeloyl-ACP methyl ester carboxylesterase
MTMRLAVTQQGSGPPLAILHGLFGSARNWTGVVQRLAERHRVLPLDLRNHGASPWAQTMSLAEMAEDVVATLGATLGARACATNERRFALLGHSLGGKVAMVAALAHSERVERLVVVDIAPVRYAAAAHLAYVRAMRGLDLAAVIRRGDADRALAAAVPDAAERAFLLQNLVLGDGPPRWRLNLPAIESAMPGLADFPSMPPCAVYAGPTLFIAGARSAYLRPEHEPAIRRLFPDAAIATIADAGHWPHAEQPAAFVDCLERFIAP